MGWSWISWFQSSLLERWRLNVKMKSDLIGSNHKNVLHFEYERSYNVCVYTQLVDNNKSNSINDKNKSLSFLICSSCIVGYMSIDFVVAKYSCMMLEHLLAQFSVPCLRGLIYAIFILLRKPRLIFCSPSNVFLSRISWVICF